MGRISRLSDQELDRLLTGRDVAGDGDLEEVTAFLRDVRGRLQEPPGSETAERHLAAMVEAAQLAVEGDGTTAKDERTGSRADRGRSGQPRSRRKLVLRNPLPPVRGKFAVALAAVTLVLVSVFGGVAYAGALPDSVQGAVADVAGTIGISLPGSEDENNLDEGNVDDVDDGKVGDLDEGNVDNVDDGAVGDLDEGQVNDLDERDVENVDDGAQGNIDDGEKGNVDEGDKGNVDERDQGNVQEGNQDEAEDSAQSGGQGHEDSGDGQSGDQSNGGNGNQGNGDN